MRPFSFAFSFPAAFLSYAHPRASRLSSRLPSRRASRLMRSVAVVRRVVRRAVSSARLVSACRLVWAPFRSAVRSFSSRLLERDCLTFPCRLVSHCFPFVPRLARRLVVASRSPSRLAHLVSVLSSRSRSSVGGSNPFSCPFPCSRRSVLLFARSCSFIGPGSY